MPLDMQDDDGDDAARPDRKRSSRARFGATGHWWWPDGTIGRTFVCLGMIIVLAGLATAVELFKTYLERDARFRITGASHIQAAGLTEVSRADLLPVFGEDIGRNIFFVPIGQRRKDLEAIPWVQSATVMRVLPDQIRINVVERHPVAFTRHVQQIGLVDANGVLLDMSPATMAQHHYSFPVVTGIDAGDPAASRQARMAMYMRLMAELDANNQRFSEQISEIDLTDPEDARVLMPEQGADILAHFGEDHFLERYQRYKAHIAEWRQQYPKLAGVDLRYEHQVVLEMNSGADTTQTTASAKPQANDPATAGTPAIAAASAPPSKPSAAAPLAKTVEAKNVPAESAKPKVLAKSTPISSTKPKVVAKTSPSSPTKPKEVAKTSTNSSAKPKVVAKTSPNSSAKAKAVAAKARQAQDKKRTAAKSATLSKPKPSAAVRAPAAAGQ
jgi:cell division protein FtsQ